MRRAKTVTVLLLALALIAGLAMLPQGIAGISDYLINEKQGTASMQTVELTLYSDKTDEPGYMMRKIALEQRMTTIPIEPEQTSMTEQEVIDAAIEGMAVYVDANMFEWFDYSFCRAEPYLGIDPENQSNNSVIWGVTFVNEKDSYHHLFLHIDDETGRILYISYETYGTDKYKYYYPENQRLMMESFADAFFRPLNLTASEMEEYKNFGGMEAVEQESTDDMTVVVYTYEDTEYGTIRAGFYISPVGFGVYFPSE